jgi:hypothetical protein
MGIFSADGLNAALQLHKAMDAVLKLARCVAEYFPLPSGCPPTRPVSDDYRTGKLSRLKSNLTKLDGKRKKAIDELRRCTGENPDPDQHVVSWTTQNYFLEPLPKMREMTNAVRNAVTCAERDRSRIELNDDGLHTLVFRAVWDFQTAVQDFATTWPELAAALTPGLPRRGAKPKYQPEDVKQVVGAWATGRYKKHSDLATALDKPIGEVKGMLEAHRKRRKAPTE